MEIKRYQDSKYKSWQNQLKRQEEKKAFEKNNKCFICDSKKDLNIHHLIYTGLKEDFFNPRYWIILCEQCHQTQPKTKNKGSKRP